MPPRPTSLDRAGILEADLAAFGKIIGGGLPVGAFGGKEEIMDTVSPTGPVYQAGTLSGNPLAMAAGYALLSELKEHPHHYDSLEEKAAFLYNGLSEVFAGQNVAVQINRVGSMFSIFFTEEEVVNYATASSTDQVYFRKFFHEMLNEGVYIPPSPFESWFIAETHDEALLEKTIEAAGKAVHKIGSNV